MKVAIVHTTRLEYSGGVAEGVTEARLGPFSDSDQHWSQFELRATPSASVNQFVDGFGNVAHLITVPGTHSFVEVVARSQVETLLLDPFRPPEAPIRPLTGAETSDYLEPSGLVPADSELSFLAAQFRPSTPDDIFTTVQSMMEMVYKQFEYVPEVTTVSTTVSELLAHPRGVCQDFAHVLIGLCRAVGIAARYVSGYIVADTRRNLEPRGVAASHAWVEAYTPTHGWRGFDPTNNLVASEFHVKMAVGRDYADVAPTRGTYRGQATEILSVAVQTHVEA